MRIEANETALIVIDLQQRLVPAMNHFSEFVHNTGILIKGMDILDIPIIITEQYPRGLGCTIPEISSVIDAPDIYEKITFSCIGSENIYNALANLNVKNVVVCGCEAHICVLQSVIDLINEEYNVYLVGDCIASRHDMDKDLAILRAQNEGAYITSYEAVLFELLERAGTEQFKKIQTIIK